MKKLTFEKFLYKNGYTTKKTSYIKIKADKGAVRFAKDMYDIIITMDFVKFQELVKNNKN
jgi:hypothetical protein